MIPYVRIETYRTFFCDANFNRNITDKTLFKKIIKATGLFEQQS